MPVQITFTRRRSGPRISFKINARVAPAFPRIWGRSIDELKRKRINEARPTRGERFDAVLRYVRDRMCERHFLLNPIIRCRSVTVPYTCLLLLLNMRAIIRTDKTTVALNNKPAALKSPRLELRHRVTMWHLGFARSPGDLSGFIDPRYIVIHLRCQRRRRICARVEENWGRVYFQELSFFFDREREREKFAALRSKKVRAHVAGNSFLN